VTSITYNAASTADTFRMAIPARHANATSILFHARTFFVTSSTWEKRNLLQPDRAAELFLKTLYEYRSQGKFMLHEFVVMPDHFHLLLTVGGNMTVERAVQFVKGGFAFSRWQRSWTTSALLAERLLRSKGFGYRALRACARIYSQ
jgi:REP element-mobilizing transposase RayT